MNNNNNTAKKQIQLNNKSRSTQQNGNCNQPTPNPSSQSGTRNMMQGNRPTPVQCPITRLWAASRACQLANQWNIDQFFRVTQSDFKSSLQAFTSLQSNDNSGGMMNQPNCAAMNVIPMCSHQSSSQSTQVESQTSQACSSSGVADKKDAAGLVKSMDKKFEKYRKKIQKDANRVPKRCKYLHQMLQKPPWGPPEQPPHKEIKSCYRDPMNPSVPEKKSGADCKKGTNNPQEKVPPPAAVQGPQTNSCGLPPQTSTQQQSCQGGRNQGGRNEMNQPIQGQNTCMNSSVPPKTDPCVPDKQQAPPCGITQDGGMPSGSCPPAKPAKVQKPNNDCNLKPFSSPSSLRKKLNQYMEVKPESKKNPIGDLLPFYDGTVDLTSCLARGAREGIEPWEIGNLVCEHPGLTACHNLCPDQSDGKTSNTSAQEEVDCFMKMMPPKLTCQQQIDYIQCMGASDDALKKFREVQAAASANANQGSCGCQSDKQSYNTCGTADVSGSKNATAQSSSPTGVVDGANMSTALCLCDQPKEENPCQDVMADGNYKAYLTKVINDANENCLKVDGQNTVEQFEDNKECEEEEPDDPNLRDLQMFGPPAVVKNRTMAETFKLYREHLSNIRRRYFGAVCNYIDDVGELTPETAAAMVITEEQGMTMKGAPAKLYEYLYPDHPSQPLLKIGEVTDPSYLPENVHSVVVPLVPPMSLETRNYPGLEDPAMLDSPRVIQIGPSLNLADEPGISEGTAPQDIVEVVTGQSDMFYVPEEDDEDEEGGGDVNDFDIKLNQAMPPHYSRFQLRGSQAPNWFPGYYVAMPSRFGVYVHEKIGNVLEKAWEETQPETVKPGGGATIIGY